MTRRSRKAVERAFLQGQADAFCASCFWWRVSTILV